MRSSELIRVGAFVLPMIWPSVAAAQPLAQGFAVERFTPSAPGGGWFVMDALDMHGALGGAASVVASYAKNPLRVSDGSQRLDVVSDEAFLEIGFAATYDRFRAHFTFDSPLVLKGNNGTVGGCTFTAPDIQFESAPDALSNARLGVDARLLGEPTDPLRIGAGAQLLFPGGGPGATRAGYLTDESYGAIGRALLAGDLGPFSYAAQLGLRMRLLDDPMTPGGPRGHELLFGAAAGVTRSIDSDLAIVVGPEVFGASAFKSFLGSGTTAVEGLFGGRVELGREGARWLRVKLGAGGAINPHFGAPEWRTVLALELSGRTDDPDPPKGLE